MSVPHGGFLFALLPRGDHDDRCVACDILDDLGMPSMAADIRESFHLAGSFGGTDQSKKLCRRLAARIRYLEPFEDAYFQTPSGMGPHGLASMRELNSFIETLRQE